MSAASELNEHIRQGRIGCACVPYDPLIGEHQSNCQWALAVTEIYRLGRLADENSSNK